MNTKQSEYKEWTTKKRWKNGWNEKNDGKSEKLIA